jgi:hypothetical protein
MMRCQIIHEGVLLLTIERDQIDQQYLFDTYCAWTSNPELPDDQYISYIQTENGTPVIPIVGVNAFISDIT